MSLRQLELQHTPALFECAKFPEIWNHYVQVIQTPEDMEAFVAEAIQFRQENHQFPFAVFDKSLGKYVGSTRYLRISGENKTLSIGCTWYTPGVWRTRVNTECKYLLLRYAFEEWKAVRVEFITTVDNEISQRAIERLGATREGILRRKYRNRDYVHYSIISDEWPTVKTRLEGYLKDVDKGE